ncbi:F-box protein SKIP28-like [Olea europaea var. sylvestris]|uniref:F-box SKIP28-like n=1 Tax=Olea europaea subsp. europaea TaxID=158383 RepID=A0A8S0UVU8_OLEEU|nr:F-box protein SKIP28-like [Olea europaea var. sylvestris]CAA3024902.1 F-box SKIP28-like [Olea europaea subsp. europaea]
MSTCSESGPPQEALFFVLAFLPVFELVSMSQVCKSLRDAINNNMPWLSVVVEPPLNKGLSDDILMKVTSKANGRLRVLSLKNCVKVTDEGLLKVVEENPFISKLYTPGCTSITPEGLIEAVKLLTKNNHSLKSIKINGINNMKKEDLETLHNLMDLDRTQQKKGKILYHEHKKCSSLGHEEIDRSIDVDVCPKCSSVRMVFDCPGDFCPRKQQHWTIECRGCDNCIPRCEECGICITGQELAEAAFADALCLECWLQLPECNFCNKPYCNQHAHQGCCKFSGSSGFVCTACHAKLS